MLYSYRNHHELVSTLAELLAKRGMDIDAFCTADFHHCRFSSVKWPWLVMIADFLINKLKIPKMQGLFNSLLRNRIVHNLISKYDVIMFESFPSSSYQYADYCIARGIPYGIGFWGSDYLRSDEKSKERLKRYLDHCKYIRNVGKLKEELINYYNVNYNINYEDKCLYAPFGNKNTYLLDNVSDESVEKWYGRFSIDSNRIIVTIGYNGHPMQHQDKVVDLISRLGDEPKKKLFLVIPMTYSSTKEQLDSVKERVSRCGVPYRIFTDFMSNEDVAILRKVSTIVVNVQDTDSFAGSIREHLYCGNIAMLGEWLDYPQLEKTEVFYVKINYDNFLEKFIDIIQNPEKYHEKCQGNHDKMKEYMSWDKSIETLYNYFYNL